ncbi:MAG: RidA family protein [Terriglobia bacterium]
MTHNALLLTATGLVLALATGLAPENPPKRRYLNLPNRPAELPFSSGVLAGNTLYLSGNLGLDPKTRKPPADIEQEVRLLLDAMKATLEEAGMTMDDLVSVTVYCPDLSLYDQFNGVYRTYFTQQFPARAFIGSGPLLFGSHFEVQGIAVKR